MHFSVSAALHHPSTASEDQRYEEASHHCSDYCCARVCRACFGTACGSGADCVYRHRPGCPSSRRGRSLFSPQKSERVVCWSARCDLLDAGVDWEAVSGLAEITLRSGAPDPNTRGRRRFARRRPRGISPSALAMRAPRALRREWIAKTQQEKRNGAECALPSQLPRAIRELQHRTKDMKKLFTTAAITAALASAVPASAQRTSPGPTSEHRYRPGCPSSRWVRSLFSAPQSERGACWFARCGPLSSTFGFIPAARSHGPARRSRLRSELWRTHAARPRGHRRGVSRPDRQMASGAP